MFLKIMFEVVGSTLILLTPIIAALVCEAVRQLSQQLKKGNHSVNSSRDQSDELQGRGVSDSAA